MTAANPALCVVVTFGRDGDPRRVGLAALLLTSLYVALLFIPESWPLRAVLALLLAAIVLPLLALVPLPRWREAESRKRTAMRGMVAEAFVIGFVAIIVRIAIR